MRTAVCLIGHFRTFDSLKEQWISLLENSQFFLHTWEDGNRLGAINEVRPLQQHQRNTLQAFDKDVVIENQVSLHLPTFEGMPPQYAAVARASKSVLSRALAAGTFDRILFSRFDVFLTPDSLSQFPSENDALVTWKPGNNFYANMFLDVCVYFHGNALQLFYNTFDSALKLRRMEDIMEERLKLCNLSIHKKFALGNDVDVMRFGLGNRILSDRNKELENQLKLTLRWILLAVGIVGVILVIQRWKIFKWSL